MDYSWLVPFLALMTLLAVCVFSLVSKAKIEERRHDPLAPKSTLAKDGPQGGVAFLLPLAQRYRQEAKLQQQPPAEPVLE